LNCGVLGEAVILTRSGVSRRQVAPAATFSPDIFEYVYFARPDSVIDGISVYRSRMAMGNALAQEVSRVLTEKQISVDVVIPVPDTSRVAALNLAQTLGLPYREGFVKNRYVGRTFIMPEQQMRYVSRDCFKPKFAYSHAEFTFTQGKKT
jgi:amidophosphoribosyltransferase